MPRRRVVDRSRGVLEVDWPLFGEMSRALALKVARGYDPEIVVGIATAGVVPGAVIAAILDKPFHSIIVSRRYQAEAVRETPTVFGSVPTDVRNRRVLLVDVREPNEFTGPLGHIRGATLVPLGELAARAPELPKDKPIVAVCRAGSRSAQAVVILQQAGFPQVANLAGGMLRWREERRPAQEGKVSDGL